MDYAMCTEIDFEVFLTVKIETIDLWNGGKIEMDELKFE
jgi:hypothetical protein